MEVAELVSKVETLQFAVAALMGLAVLLWMSRNPDCRCDQCAFHRHERAEKARKDRELAHDLRHRGIGNPPDSPDIHACSDKDCLRNPK